VHRIALIALIYEVSSFTVINPSCFVQLPCHRLKLTALSKLLYVSNLVDQTSFANIHRRCWQAVPSSGDAAAVEKTVKYLSFELPTFLVGFK